MQFHAVPCILMKQYAEQGTGKVHARRRSCAQAVIKAWAIVKAMELLAQECLVGNLPTECGACEMRHPKQGLQGPATMVDG